MKARTAKKKFLINALALMTAVTLCVPHAMAASEMSASMTDASGKFYSDYNSQAEVRAAGIALNEAIAEEGFVLLKNNGALPYVGVETVSVFGKSANGLQNGGSGSGGFRGDSTGLATIYDSLEAVGLSVNPALRSFYADNSRSGAGRGENRIGETPQSSYTRQVTESFKLYNDAAIVVFSRQGVENADMARVGVTDDADPVQAPAETSKHYLELSDNEEALLELVKANFDTITVILNSASPMEVGELQDDDAIDSIIWIGTPGLSGINALGRILTGEVNPSGRLVDIYARDFRQDPVQMNFGNGNQTTADGSINYDIKDKNGNEIEYQSSAPVDPNIHSVAYEEGIYMGYRYYETAGEIYGENWYRENVVYPFGYGLSYTNFEWRVETPSSLTLTENGKIEINVTVTNVGSVAGKDVVQLYYTAPYNKTTAPIEKSHKVLGAFAKTEMLRPGQSQTVTLTMDVQDMASYDYNDINKNGFTGYELEAGRYILSISSDSHTAVKELTYTLQAGIQYDTDKVTGATVENRFTGGQFNSLPEAQDIDMTILSRSDFAGTYPQAPTKESLSVKDGSTLEDRMKHVFSLDDIEDANDSRHRTAEDATGMTQFSGDVSTRTIKLTLRDMAGLSYDDPKWDELLNQLTMAEIVDFVGNGNYHTAALEAIGKEQVADSDGPSALKDIWFCGEPLIAATFNTELAEQMGQIIGNEALWAGIGGWYAPAMNLHRSPFSGRTFEYYSEDPLLSGKMAAAEVRGAQSKGLYVYIKHFAVNDQETMRYDLITYIDEQALRELYLRPFQIAVQEGGAVGVMSAFDRIGTVPCDGNYALLTQVLRDEWGFKGAVVTDYYGGTMTAAFQNPNYLYSAGNDIPLSAVAGRYSYDQYQGEWDPAAGENGQGCWVYQNAEGNTVKSYSQWLAFRKSAKNILYVAANSNQLRNGINMNAFAGKADLTSTVYEKVDISVAADTAELGTTNVSYTATGLPAGLTLNAATGAISGSPTTEGTYNFQIGVTADGWVTSVQNFTIEVAPAFVVADNALANAKVGTPFSAQFASPTVTADAFNAGIAYEVSGGALPAGMTLAEDGTLSGTPTESGRFVFTIHVAASNESLNWWTGQTTVATTNFYQDVELVVAATDGTGSVGSTGSTDSTDGILFRVNNGSLEYSADGNTWAPVSNSTSTNGDGGFGGAIGVGIAIVAAIAAIGAAVVLFLRKKK